MSTYSFFLHEIYSDSTRPT